MTYWLRLSEDKPGLTERTLALPFDFLWNFPLIAVRLWKTWRKEYGG